VKASTKIYDTSRNISAKFSPYRNVAVILNSRSYDFKPLDIVVSHVSMLRSSSSIRHDDTKSKKYGRRSHTFKCPYLGNIHPVFS